MTTLEQIIGLEIVGYRYGKAPECGRSYNTYYRRYEPGVSMACVGYDREISSFAIDAYEGEGVCYYVGRIAGFGGDGEICLKDVRKITKRQYASMLKKCVEASNALVNYKADRDIDLIRGGWHIGKNEERVEQYRREHLH